MGNRRYRIVQPLPTLAAKNSPPPLLYADTERSSDALYFGRVGVPDPFVAFGLRGKKYAVVSALEFGRVKKTSDFDVVLPLEVYLKRARDLWPQRRPGAAEVIFLLSKDLKQSRFTVPEDFPAGVFDKLFELGLDLEVAEGALFPEREIKTPRTRAASGCPASSSARARSGATARTTGDVTSDSGLPSTTAERAVSNCALHTDDAGTHAAG